MANKSTKSPKSVSPKSVSPAPSYESYRVETRKSGEKNRIYKFDGRSEDGLVKARDFANVKFTAGYKVTLYKLDKVGEEWVRTDIKSADGRKSESTAKSSSKTSSAKSTKPATKSSSKTSSAKSTKATKSAPAPQNAAPSTDISELAKKIDLLVLAVSKLVEVQTSK